MFKPRLLTFLNLYAVGVLAVPLAVLIRDYKNQDAQYILTFAEVVGTGFLTAWLPAIQGAVLVSIKTNIYRKQIVSGWIYYLILNLTLVVFSGKFGLLFLPVMLKTIPLWAVMAPLTFFALHWADLRFALLATLPLMLLLTAVYTTASKDPVPNR